MHVFRYTPTTGVGLATGKSWHKGTSTRRRIEPELCTRRNGINRFGLDSVYAVGAQVNRITVAWRLTRNVVAISLVNQHTRSRISPEWSTFEPLY